MVIQGKPYLDCQSIENLYRNLLLRRKTSTGQTQFKGEFLVGLTDENKGYVWIRHGWASADVVRALSLMKKSTDSFFGDATPSLFLGFDGRRLKLFWVESVGSLDTEPNSRKTEFRRRRRTLFLRVLVWLFAGRSRLKEIDWSKGR